MCVNLIKHRSEDELLAS